MSMDPRTKALELAKGYNHVGEDYSQEDVIDTSTADRFLLRVSTLIQETLDIPGMAESLASHLEKTIGSLKNSWHEVNRALERLILDIQQANHKFLSSSRDSIDLVPIRSKGALVPTRVEARLVNVSASIAELMARMLPDLKRALWEHEERYLNIIRADCLFQGWLEYLIQQLRDHFGIDDWSSADVGRLVIDAQKRYETVVRHFQKLDKKREGRLIFLLSCCYQAFCAKTMFNIWFEKVSAEPKAPELSVIRPLLGFHAQDFYPHILEAARLLHDLLKSYAETRQGTFSDPAATKHRVVVAGYLGTQGEVTVDGKPIYTTRSSFLVWYILGKHAKRGLKHACVERSSFNAELKKLRERIKDLPTVSDLKNIVGHIKRKYLTPEFKNVIQGPADNHRQGCYRLSTPYVTVDVKVRKL